MGGADGAYAGIQELTAENLNRLVDRIEVFDRTGSGEETTQTITVDYRFGGYIAANRFAAKVLSHPKKERKAA